MQLLEPAPDASARVPTAAGEMQKAKRAPAGPEAALRRLWEKKISLYSSCSMNVCLLLKKDLV